MPSQVSYTINFVVGGNTTETVVIKYKANNETTYTVATTVTVPPGVPQSYTLGPFDSHIVYDVILETECEGGGTEFGGIRYLANFVCSPFTLEFVGSDLAVQWECFVDETTGDSVKEYRIEYRLFGSTGPFTSVTFPISAITSYWAANPGSYPFYTELLTTGINPALSYEVNHYTVIEYNYYNVDPPITIEVIINETLPCNEIIEGTPCDTCDALAFDTDPGTDGTYIDDDSLILVNLNGGTFDNYFLKVGEASTADGVGSSITFLNRTMVYIDNPSSVYYGKIAIKSVSWNSNFSSRIQIWDPATNPTTPTLVATFDYKIGAGPVITGFGNHLFGTIAYDAVDDAIYAVEYNFKLVKFDFATGTFTQYPAGGFSFFYPPTPWSFNPFPEASGNVSFTSVIVNPVTRRRYILASGVLVFPANSGCIGILAPDNDTVERVFPHDSAPLIIPGSTAYPANLRTEIAPSSGIAFDSAGNAYMVSRTNCTDYSLAQNDIVVLDGVTHDYITSINYDVTQTWLPYSSNNYTWNHVSYYDGSGFIPGEKILVLYRNYGPAINPHPPAGNTWTTPFPGTSARLVAIDTTTYAASVILEIPDSTFGGGIDAFVYSYKYNKIFFSVFGYLNKIVAYDGVGLSIYNENMTSLGNAYTYQGVEAFDCGRIVYITGDMNPGTNMYVIEPAALCSEGVVNFPANPSITLDGPYIFDDTTSSWSELSSMVVSPGLTDFTVTSTFDPSIVDAVLLVSTDGGVTYIPYEDQTSALYAIPAAWNAGRTYNYPPGFAPPSLFQFSIKIQMNNGTCAYNSPYSVIPCPGAGPLTPLGPISGPTSGICNASNVNYSLGTSDANAYSWSYPAGVTASGIDNLNAINLNFGAGFISGTITVTAYYCYGETQTSSIFVDGTPLPPTITPGSSSIGPDVSELYTASSTGATTYNWTITGDVAYEACTNPPTCSQWSIIWGPTGVGSISVTAQNSCGVSAPTVISNP
jgi:hypothetical protein